MQPFNRIIPRNKTFFSRSQVCNDHNRRVKGTVNNAVWLMPVLKLYYGTSVQSCCANAPVPVVWLMLYCEECFLIKLEITLFAPKACTENIQNLLLSGKVNFTTKKYLIIILLWLSFFLLLHYSSSPLSSWCEALMHSHG